MNAPMLELAGVTKTFTTGMGRRRHRVVAVNDASFQVERGETFGLVGESGSGKSTLARLASRLITADAGSIRLAGRELVGVRERELRPVRRQVQMVFQDPYSSLDPSWTVFDIVGEPLRVHLKPSRSERIQRVTALLKAVELEPDVLNRYPHEFSGGQRQRIAIARALVLEPPLVVCDEAVSALDMSTQAAILNLLVDLQEQRGLTYLFISHDLSVIRHVSDRVGVMYRGAIVEIGLAEQVCDHPTHPYSRLLYESVPAIEPEPVVKPASEPAARPPRSDPGLGCPFYERCPLATSLCESTMPPLSPKRSGAAVACHHVD